MIKATVVIPTKNPGSIFKRVIESVVSQKTSWPFEIIVIDSGSSDGTIEYASTFPLVRVISIPPSEFGHGKTRNKAIDHAQGEFVALLTHDALPENENWLSNLVAAVEQDPMVAGAFGRHLAYPEATPYTRHEMEQHFAGFMAHPLVVSKDTDPVRFANDVGWRQFLHYYSDNNSCLRRSVWESLPYPDVEFAEDQIWAARIIEAGWRKAYAKDAVVYHSHEYGPFEKLQRSFDEGMAFRKLFGYRLGGKPRHMLKSIFKLGQNDWRWGKENSVPFRLRLDRLLENAGLVVGHVLGSRYESVPDWLQNKLSRDKRLFNSLPGRRGAKSTAGKTKDIGATSTHTDGSTNSASTGQTEDQGYAMSPAKIDILKFWSFISDAPFGQELNAQSRPEKGTLNWFVPPFGRGSGGHLNIFRFVRNLELLGFDCRIIICNDHSGADSQLLQQQIREWFFPLKAPVYKYPEQSIPSTEISVATGWQTAYTVKAFRGTQYRCYFVQDFEPYFNPLGTEYALAEETYRFGFVGITAGGWLAHKLKDEYGMETHPFQFSYDHDLYKPHPRRDAIQRVFFYARPPTPRRAFDLGVMILAELAKRMPETEMVLAGWDVSGYELPFRNLQCGILNVAELPDLYSHCDAALVLSFTNASLLPPELMACGCAVVSNTGENNEWLLDEECAVIAKPTVMAMADALQRVLQDAEYRNDIINKGYIKANSTTWEHEAEKVATVFRELVNRHD